MPCAPALAEDYPTRAIRVISPYPAGSASDTVSRVVLDEVSREIGQAIVIETRPGAGGSLGFSTVAKAAARRLHAGDKLVVDGDRARAAQVAAL